MCQYLPFEIYFYRLWFGVPLFGAVTVSVEATSTLISMWRYWRVCVCEEYVGSMFIIGRPVQYSGNINNVRLSLDVTAQVPSLVVFCIAFGKRVRHVDLFGVN